jgi:maltose/moltooligosaccharide transporter
VRTYDEDARGRHAADPTDLVRTTEELDRPKTTSAADTVEAGRPPSPRRQAATRKPLMTTRQILLMNFGFFGIQYSFELQRSAVSPIYNFLGASPEELPILNIAGPLTGLLVQPLIGALSDRTWHPRWGRRRPFFLIGAVGCSIALFLFPFVAALWMAALLLLLLDVSNNTAMEPYKAFVADKLHFSQLGKGFLVQSLFTGFGAVLASGSLFVFQRLITSGTEAGIPYWVFGSFMLGSVLSLVSILVTTQSTPENPPTPQELAELRAKKGGFGAALVEIGSAIKDMPVTLRKLALVYLFQWYALWTYWQYNSLSLAESVFHTSPEADKDRYSEAVGWLGAVNTVSNTVTMISALVLVALAARFGAKWVHTASLVLAAAGLLAYPHMGDKLLILIPVAGIGFAWASIMAVPYILVVSAIPKERYGVYVGIVNMMICLPMLIQTFTFKPIYRTILNHDPRMAITFTGVLMLLAAASMLWIRQPTQDDQNQEAAVPA